MFGISAAFTKSCHIKNAVLRQYHRHVGNGRSKTPFLKMLKLKPRLPQTLKIIGYSLKLQCHVIASQEGMQLIMGDFLMGNHAFIMATKFTGLVARLLTTWSIFLISRTVITNLSSWNNTSNLFI